MSFTELLLIGVGVSMDAFAVAVCKGLAMSRINKSHTLIIALFFGGFQAIMPLIGWLLGTRFEAYITSVDHWIAFVLLSFIGVKMIYEAFEESDAPCECDARLNIKELCILSIATSIDALAIGITFAFLKVAILPAVSIIGITTFLLAIVGVAVGNRFGSKYKKRAEITGGVILMIIGLKILFEHTGLLPF